VISPGSAQDLRCASNAGYFADTGTPWIRMWADWPSLQPDGRLTPDDARNPGCFRLRALDEQIALARARGLKVLLMPYRFPLWANGTEPLAARGAVTPRHRALQYRLPDDPYGPQSHWARFFAFLYARYHGAVEAFEIVNEPNLQLWPQRGIERHIAQLFKTAQEISARFGHSAMLLGPSISDADAPSGPLHTHFADFVPALLDAFAEVGYAPHARQAWSHHNYTDVEKRRDGTQTQRIRGLLAGRWNGYGGSASPVVFVTEGGARLSRMPALYPDEAPRRAQARCVRQAWQQRGGSVAGVAMLAQYLLYADPNFDCGLLDPYPSTEKRPAYAAWKAFPVAG
jgi:hypothetical protein